MHVIHLQHQLAGQLEIEVHVDREHRLGLSGIGLHGEGDRHRDHQIVLGVIDVGVLSQIAAFAALAENHDAGVIQHRGARQGAIRTQEAHAFEGAEIVAFDRCEGFHELHHARGACIDLRHHILSQ
ncbi:hypothetical protein D3C81_906520 [compost metagenome]